MFTWLNKQGVQSDLGFVVQFTGRFTAEYRDRGKVVTLSVEDGLIDRQPCISVDPDAFDHWDGETAKIHPAQQRQMFKNLGDAVEFQDMKLVIERRRGIDPADDPQLFMSSRRR
jgi:hypothetical protein